MPSPLHRQRQSPDLKSRDYLQSETHTMVAEFLNGNIETARKIQIKYKHLIDIRGTGKDPRRDRGIRGGHQAGR